MNFLKNVSFNWWQMGLLKLSLISLGIVLGVTFNGLLYPFSNLFLILFIVPAVYIAYIWFKQ